MRHDCILTSFSIYLYTHPLSNDQQNFRAFLDSVHVFAQYINSISVQQTLICPIITFQFLSAVLDIFKRNLI
jgi:hypothetical protein